MEALATIVLSRLSYAASRRYFMLQGTKNLDSTKNETSVLISSQSAGFGELLLLRPPLKRVSLTCYTKHHVGAFARTTHRKRCSHSFEWLVLLAQGSRKVSTTTEHGCVGVRSPVARFRLHHGDTPQSPKMSHQFSGKELVSVVKKTRQQPRDIAWLLCSAEGLDPTFQPRQQRRL